MKKLGKLKIVFLMALIIFPFYSFAQLGEGDVVLTLSPENPKQDENVTATLNSYLTDLNISYITWLKNDELQTEGVGKKIFYFNVGELNTDITLSARINTTGGDTVIKTITITPTEIDMLWEAVDSYVPPFYKGKALIAQEGSFKVVAIPNAYTLGNKINPKNLSYTWTRDGTVAQNYSGWGKNYYIFKNSYLEKENEIEVSATDLLGKIKPVGSITLQVFQPKIVFYEKKPEFGIELKKAISNNYTLTKEETLAAVPYFFSPKDLNKDELKFDWEIDNIKISTPINKNEISLKGEEGGSGEAIVKLIINNTKTLFQELETTINVNF